MRAVIQRVSRAEITIDHQETREIGQGLVVFLGVMKGDTEAQAEFLAEKAQGLRIFTDENGKMNLSLEDIGGAQSFKCVVQKMWVNLILHSQIFSLFL